jgi:glucose-6-phosphate isomerase
MTGYEQDISQCRESAIGAKGVPEAALAAECRKLPDLVAQLRRACEDGSLPVLRLPRAREDIAGLVGIAERFAKSCTNVVVLGTGGSSLGGQALTALADRGFGPRKGRPSLVFPDNIDPDTFAAMFDSLDPATTGVLMISKSGGTAETLMQSFACLERWGGGSPANFLAIAEPGDNPLRRLAERHGIPVLDHDPLIGGRYSVLSLVGLLPAAIAGLDIATIRAGAAGVLDATLDDAGSGDAAPAIGAALAVALLKARGTATTVLMPYLDRLANFGLWYRQLWAESLGKNGTGTTPIRAMGTVDQHSQLQLYLAGPADKLFTLIVAESAGTGPVVPAHVAREDSRLGYLAGKRMGDLLQAEAAATAATLARNGRPTRVIRIATLDERVLGALMMHFMLETILAAGLLGVDAFDQPAVEEGKQLAREYLAKVGAA